MIEPTLKTHLADTPGSPSESVEAETANSRIHLKFSCIPAFRRLSFAQSARSGIMNVSRALMLALLLVLAICAASALAQDEGPAPAAAVAATGDEADDETRKSLLQLIMTGGPIMIPIGIASILALAIAVERSYSLRRDKVIPAGFIAGLRDEMKRGDEGNQGSIAYCESVGGPVGDLFKAGMQRLSRGEDAVEKAIEDAAIREVEKLKRSLRGLAIVANVAPLLGLLGTVYGMIGAFQDATIAGMGKADMLAEGIYQALVTTAAGLTIAIPALLAYQYLSSRVDALVDEIDEMCIDFMNSCLDLKSDLP